MQVRDRQGHQPLSPKGRSRYQCLLQKTGMNAKKNSRIGLLADNCLLAIKQEKLVNQDVHSVKGKVSSNIGKIIESIINDEP